MAKQNEFFKSIMDSVSSITTAFANAPAQEKKQERRSNGNFTDAKDDASRIKFLTTQFIDTELAIDKNKNDWQVFSQHHEPLIRCLKRYEDARLSQLEVLQKEQATAILEALQQGKELAEQSGNGALVDREDYVNGLKKSRSVIARSTCLPWSTFWITFRSICAMEKMPAPHGNRSEKIPVKSAGKTLIRPAGRNRFITLRVRSFLIPPCGDPGSMALC